MKIDITMSIARAMLAKCNRQGRHQAAEDIARVWFMDRIRVLLVRYEYDEGDIQDVKGDSYCSKSNPDISPDVLRIAELELEARIEREGLWGMVGEYCGEDREWVETGACYGFVGDEGIGSGYDEDIVLEALGGFDSLRLRT